VEGPWPSLGAGDRREQPPIPDIEVQIRGGFDVVASTVIDADDEFSFTLDLTLPRDAIPGDYRADRRRGAELSRSEGRASRGLRRRCAPAT